MKRCSNGHHYDATMHKYCPFCSIENNINPTNKIAVKKFGLLKKKARNSDEASKHTVLAMDHNPGTPRIDMPLSNRNNIDQSNIKVKQAPLKKGSLPVGILFLKGNNNNGYFPIYNTGSILVARHDNLSMIHTDLIKPSDQVFCSFKYEHKQCIVSARSREMLINNNKIELDTVMRNKDILSLGTIKMQFILVCEGGFQW